MANHLQEEEEELSALSVQLRVVGGGELSCFSLHLFFTGILCNSWHFYYLKNIMSCQVSSLVSHSLRLLRYRYARTTNKQLTMHSHHARI